MQVIYIFAIKAKRKKWLKQLQQFIKSFKAINFDIKIKMQKSYVWKEMQLFISTQLKFDDL